MQPGTDVGMHGLLAISCYHSVLPPSLCTLWTSSRFKQTSLHPFDFVRNLFHLLVQAMDRIDFPSVWFWLGQIAAEKCLCFTKCRCTVSE